MVESVNRNYVEHYPLSEKNFVACTQHFGSYLCPSLPVVILNVPVLIDILNFRFSMLLAAIGFEPKTL